MHFKRLAGNFLSLTFLQAINYLLPVLLLPFLISRVGITNYGITSYMLTVLMPIKIIVDYGYNISGLKETALNKSDKYKLSDIVSRIFFTKVYLLTAVIVLLVIIISLLPQAFQYKNLIGYTLLVAIGQSMLPLWFFQALEITYLALWFSVVTRIIYLLGIFNLIKKPEDFVLINGCLGICDILLSVFCFFYIFKIKHIKLRVIKWNEFKQEIRDNFYLAKTNILVMASLNTPYIFLGIFADKTVLGYYSIADKILQVIRTSVSILYASVLPRIINLYNESKTKLYHFIIRFHWLIIIVYLAAFLFCFLLPEKIIQIITNSKTPNIQTIIAIKILAIIPLFNSLYIIPSQLLVIEDRNRTYASILLKVVLIGFIISITLVLWLGYLGSAISAVLIESIIFLFMIKSNMPLYKNCFKKQ